MLAHSHFSCGASRCFSLLCETIKSTESIRGARFILRADLRVGLDAIVNAIAIYRYLNFCCAKKLNMPISFRDPLSESVAPSGTA